MSERNINQSKAEETLWIVQPPLCHPLRSNATLDFGRMHFTFHTAGDRDVVCLCLLAFVFVFFLYFLICISDGNWLEADFSGPWERLLRRLCSIGTFLLCCSWWPEWWLHYFMGPIVTQESLAEKKMLVNYDDWKIGLVPTSPETRQCKHRKWAGHTFLMKLFQTLLDCSLELAHTDFWNWWTFQLNKGFSQAFTEVRVMSSKIIRQEHIWHSTSKLKKLKEKKKKKNQKHETLEVKALSLGIIDHTKLE